ncbi:MAG: hypothetical protein JW860_15075 [Sedimentisphaerales bacterium]|nr:hypothetical protein [Sedimentisphaerales bacterium]
MEKESMEPVEKGKEGLISSIETDARAEAEKIIQDAEERAVEKRKYTQKQVESLLNTTREKSKEQTDALTRKIMSNVELEIKRHTLQVRQAIIQDIMDQVEKKLEAMISEPDYRSVLIDWMTEAALGLDVESARVNASEKERVLINDKLLSEVRKKIRTEFDRQINLTLSEDRPLDSQGLVLTTLDGRMAYNCQVKTRMLRKQRKIHKLIYDALFAGK